MKIKLTRIALSTLYPLLSTLCLPAQNVQITPNEAQHRVDITIDGHPFTSYLWATNQRKPVLFPIIAPDGTTITRGYPFTPLPGERVDHPHHAGLWFNYGNANGYDFWNNSDAIPEKDRPKYGAITHDRIVSIKPGTPIKPGKKGQPDTPANPAKLTTESTWTTAANQKILQQTTTYGFSAITINTHPARAIDVIVTLKALDKVTFHDDKEGLLGLRVAQFLESPNEKSAIFNDANGKPTTVQGASPNATGLYRTSAGITGDAVWSTRARWCSLTGHTPDDTVETIAIFNHSGNPGTPPYWHARGYGLFAVNPLGAHIFDPKAPELNLTLNKGESVTFKYRVLIVSGDAPDKSLNAEADFFDNSYYTNK